jgi:alanine racemase
MKNAYVDVDLGALAENVRRVRGALPERVALMMVVKANAYGHGTYEVARRAARAGVGWFAVAHLHEALEVRRAAPGAEIVVMGVAGAEDVPALLDARLHALAVSLEQGRALAAAARAAGRALPVHVKVDTGMGRLGMHWEDAAGEASGLLEEPGLEVRGLCTHFARVDAGEEDPAREQYRRFHGVAGAIEARARRPLFKHVSSSRAALLHPEWDLDGVRPGIVLYGYGASSPGGRFVTRPILEWRTRVMQARRVPARFAVGYYGTYVTPAPTTIAVIGLGYADGYLRALSNKAHVLIGGRRCRVVGRVSMNWITVDVGPYANVRQGDEVVLLGRQGNQEIWADELAILCRTIPYEILTGINASIDRRYSGGD